MRKGFYYLLLVALCLFPGFSQAQNTVGVTTLDEFNTYFGYNLIYSAPQSNVYLLDNCGRVVNSWTDSTVYRPGNAVNLLENGNLLKTKRNFDVSGDPIWAGGGGETLELRDWDNNLLWSMTINDSLERLHHDAIYTPSGTIMMIVWEKKNFAESVQAGRDTALMSDNEVWSDYILEIEPIFPDSFNVVWEWHAWDHLVQNYDSTKDNFGDPSLQRGKIDLNYVGLEGAGPDWLHSNALDFNQALNQVVLSVPEFNEIWIIDHSTTTAEAAGSTGGLSNRGGDLMYRWGNPMAYGRGDSSDIQLHYMHNPNWIDDFVTPSVNDFNKMMIFNNRNPEGPAGQYSTVDIINPTFIDYEWRYETDANGVYLPSSPDWRYVTPDTVSMYSNIVSSAQRLPNNNTLIGVGRQGYMLEIDENNNIVWEFRSPLTANGPLSQGDTLNLSASINWRIKRYPETYGAFTGRTLTPGPYLELNPDSTFCQRLDVSSVEPTVTVEAVYPNPANDLLTIERSTPKPVQAALYNLHGQLMREATLRSNRDQFDVKGLTQGIYFLRVGNEKAVKIMVQN